MLSGTNLDTRNNNKTGSITPSNTPPNSPRAQDSLIANDVSGISLNLRQIENSSQFSITDWWVKQLDEFKKAGHCIEGEDVTLFLKQCSNSLEIRGTSNIGKKSFRTFSDEFFQFLEKIDDNNVYSIELFRTQNNKIIGFKVENDKALCSLIEDYDLHLKSLEMEKVVYDSSILGMVQNSVSAGANYIRSFVQ